MSDFTLVIRGGTDSTLPPLTLSFNMGNLMVAKRYARMASCKIANNNYRDFALFRVDEGDQELIEEWKVKLIATIEGSSANDC